VTIVLNGQPHLLADDATLNDAVAALADATSTGAGRGIAVAVNGVVVPRGAWAHTPLAEADKVEVLTAVQGG
jgi:sulfur carrier protein